MRNYNRSPSQIKEIAKMINRLDSRAEELFKKVGEYHPAYKEYAQIFQKIGGTENISVGSKGNLRLKRGKVFIDSLSDTEIKKLKYLESKNLTYFHEITRIKKEQGVSEEQANVIFKQYAYDAFISENLALIYNNAEADKLIHVRGRKKTYDELAKIIELVGGIQ